MLHNKKTFLLLLSIPMYLATRFFLFLTFDTGISIPLLVSICMFVLSAAILLYSKERMISVQISIIVHLIVVIPVLLNVSTIPYSKEDLLQYTLFFLPALLYIALFTAGERDSENDASALKKKTKIITFSFNAALAVLAGVLFWTAAHKKTALSPGFDINSTVFVLICLASAFWLGKLIIKRESFLKPVFTYLQALFVLSLFETTVYIIWANQFFDLEFEPLFSLILVYILVIDISRKEPENIEIEK